MRSACLSLCVLFAVLCSPPAALAVEPKPAPKAAPKERMPPAEEINPVALNRNVRLSLARVVDFLRRESAKDPDGWFIPPRRQRTVVDWKDVTVRYSKRIVKHPVYEYETYEDYAPVGSGDSFVSVTTLQKVKKTRIKRQIGTKDVETVVWDYNGPFETTTKQPIWGPGGPDYWRSGQMGHNALCVYVMRKAGVPAADETVNKVAGKLADIVESYGLPDETWDLAWLSAAFSVMPTNRFKVLTEKMASKLLDGQITDAPARGLWGPDCVNPDLMAAAMIYERQLAEEYKKRKAIVTQQYTTDRDQKMVEAEKSILKLQWAMRRQISPLTTAFQEIDGQTTIGPEGYQPITVVGLFTYAYNQTSADIGSTAAALVGLRAANALGMPKETFRPTIEGTIRPLMMPEKSSAVFARAATAIAAVQTRSGTWDEVNLHQPVKAFDKLNIIEGVPAVKRTFVPLKSTQTYLSTLEGYSALLSTGLCAGLEKLMGRFRGNVAAGMSVVRKLAENLADGTYEDAEVGGLMRPYDCYLYLPDALKRLGSVAVERRDLWSRLAYRLLKEQGKDGAWGPKKPVEFVPTSFRARIEALGPMYEGTTLRTPRSDAHVRLNWWHVHNAASLPDRYSAPPEFLATAYASLFLIDGVRPPVAAECMWTESAGASVVLPLVTLVMRQKNSVDLSYSVIGPDLPAGLLVGLPALVIRGSGPFSAKESARTSLQGYLARGGTVILETTATPEGQSFLNDGQAALAKLVDGAATKNIGEDRDLFGDLAGKINVPAVVRADGSPAIVPLPLGDKAQAAAPCFALPEAAQITYCILLRRMDAKLLDEAYPVSTADLEGGGQFATTLDDVVAKPPSAPAAAPATPAAPAAAAPPHAPAPAATPPGAAKAPAAGPSATPKPAEKPAAAALEKPPEKPAEKKDDVWKLPGATEEKKAASDEQW